MCPPIVMAALAVGQAAAGYAGASQAADAQNEAYTANAREAQRAATVSYTNLGIRRNQTLESANQQTFQSEIEALKARSTAATAAGEAGVGGQSVTDIVNDLFAQQGRRRQNISTQFEMDSRQIQTEMDNTQGQSQQRINSVQRANPPSPLSYIIQGASGIASAYATANATAKAPASGSV